MKSLMRLPPDDDSLTHHIKRANCNFLAYIQCHPDQRSHPSPIDHGWELVNGHCRPVRYTTSALPVSLPVHSLPQDGYDSDSEDNSGSVADSNYEAESEASDVLDSSDESD